MRGQWLPFFNLFSVWYIATLSICDSTIAQQQSADSELRTTFRAWLDEECKRHPVFSSQQGNREFDGLMDDLSPEARQADKDRDADTLRSLNQFAKSKSLSRNGEIDLEIWQSFLQYRLWQSANSDDFANDPRIYLIYCSDSVFGLFTQSTLPKHRNIANATTRIAAIPKVIEAAKASIKNPPKEITEVAIKRTEGAISFYEKDIFAIADESPQVSSLATPSRQAVAALRDYKQFLEHDVLPRSTGDWRIGKAKFAEKLAMELDAGLTAQEVIDIAESESTRVELEMYYVAKQLWHRTFQREPLPPDDPEGRRERLRYGTGSETLGFTICPHGTYLWSQPKNVQGENARTKFCSHHLLYSVH